MVDRICELAHEKGISISALEKTLGLGNGIIGKWRKQSPSCDKLKLVADYLNATIDYLLTGKKECSSTANLTPDEHELLQYFKKLSDKSKGIVLGRAEQLAELETPVVKEPEPEQEPTIQIKHSYYRVSAGTGFNLPEGDDWEMIDIPDTPEARRADFAITIKGNSMEPVYFDGDIVLVKQQPAVELGEIGIFNIENNGYIKKFGGDRLISLNDAYDDIILSEYDEDRNHCLGKVIGRV
nr:MAG TPA: Repressor protein CI [Caudoviricetes sp.]